MFPRINGEKEILWKYPMAPWVIDLVYPLQSIQARMAWTSNSVTDSFWSFLKSPIFKKDTFLFQNNQIIAIALWLCILDRVLAPRFWRSIVVGLHEVEKIMFWLAILISDVDLWFPVQPVYRFKGRGCHNFIYFSNIHIVQIPYQETYSTSSCLASSLYIRIIVPYVCISAFSY